MQKGPAMPCCALLAEASKLAVDLVLGHVMASNFVLFAAPPETFSDPPLERDTNLFASEALALLSLGSTFFAALLNHGSGKDSRSRGTCLG